MDNTRVLSVFSFLPPTGAAGQRPEFDIKPPLGAPLLILPQKSRLRLRDVILKGYELSGEIALKNNHYYYLLLSSEVFSIRGYLRKTAGF